MSFFKRIGDAVRRKFHEREIRDSLSYYERASGHRADRKQSFADTGTFRYQVDRLFAIGNAAETAQLKQLAKSAVSNTITNRYYRPADYLSDIYDDLDATTFFTGESSGEAPLSSLTEQVHRELKLKAVMEAWLVPLKVGSIEHVVAEHARLIGRRLPYTALQRFERAAAKLFANVAESERKLTQEYVLSLLTAWSDEDAVRARFTEPADAMIDAYRFLVGESRPDGVHHLRTRRADQPLRLSTVVPEDRQHYLRVTLDLWTDSP